MNKKALIIIDVQNDCCPGGTLAVSDGDKIIPAINKISNKFDKVIATQDWHPKGHISFASTHNKEPYQAIETKNGTQVLWPDHCVQDTPGAGFHKELILKHVDLIIRKGTDPGLDSYSALLENDKQTETGLQHYLKGLNINEVFLCGLATDYCVYFSAVDVKNAGFNATVILDACRGVDVPEGNIQKAIDDMKNKNIGIINHDEL